MDQISEPKEREAQTEICPMCMMEYDDKDDERICPTCLEDVINSRDY